MTAKPPERIRAVMNRYGCIAPDLAPIREWDREHPDCTPHTEHFYTLEKEPMQKKTENLTVQEAWAAMARGEFVQTKREVYHLLNLYELRYWNGQFWVNTSVLEEGPYSIVPDPSKPKDVEYEKDKAETIAALKTYELPGDHENKLIAFIERNFEKRKP